MTLARRLRRKCGNTNVSFKDVAIHRLTVNLTDQGASVRNARFFRDGPKIHPLKNTLAQTYFSNYKWCRNCMYVSLSIIILVISI